MPLMQHLDELRKRLTVVVLVLLVLIVVMYAFSEPIYRLVTAPVADLIECRDAPAARRLMDEHVKMIRARRSSEETASLRCC